MVALKHQDVQDILGGVLLKQERRGGIETGLRPGDAAAGAGSRNAVVALKR